MAGGGGENYVYTEIEQCVAKMSDFTKSIKNQSDDLIQEVKQLINNGEWSGVTADDYQKRAMELGQKLEQSSQQMDSTGKAVTEAAEHMKQVDQQGAGAMGG